MEWIREFKDLELSDLPIVGGKNASLGEMLRVLSPLGISIPSGFATTAEAFFAFLDFNRLRPKIFTLKGKAAREKVIRGKFPPEIEKEIVVAYQTLSEQCRTHSGKRQKGQGDMDVAVRSSATAEDLPEASFAGQQESYLNVAGKRDLLASVRCCFASLFTDRAIAYREEKGFAHDQVALSVGVQEMVRADLGSSGVLFTVDTETGFKDVVIINAAFGLGENIVQGTIEPDEYMVYKPLLGKETFEPIIGKQLGTKALKMVYGKKGVKNLRQPEKDRRRFALEDEQILILSKWAVAIEKHYQKPMDIEWAFDGKKLYILQARPETVQSAKKGSLFHSYTLEKKGKKRLEGVAIGDAIVSGKVQVIKSVAKIKSFKSGSILVTGATSPDWVPIMKQASGIITDHGGRTSHAAIVSRELGLPAIVGTHSGTDVLKNQEMITLSCAEGDTGFVYEGALPFSKEEIDISSLPKPPVDILLNLASPHEALRFWPLPVKGVGLARMEFIISDEIKAHPMALAHFSSLKDRKAAKEIEQLTRAYESKEGYFIEKLAQGIGKIAASVYPYPVIVRMSDFKTNEYASLIGGEQFEEKEENPMLGFRGASRYYSPRYREGFGLECRAILHVREVLGFDNVCVMIPFCRTIDEAKAVFKVMEEEGLKRGEISVYVMCEVPSNVILAQEFARLFDGFSIGSNDLTQLVLGVDRDAEGLKAIFDERNEAVKLMIRQVIEVAKKEGKKIGICGQGPSDYPEFANFLIEAGIDSISLNPDSVIEVIEHLS